MSEIENPIPSLPPTSIHMDEILIRIFYHPDHIDDSGKIKPSAVSSEQLKIGASVDRKKYANRGHIEKNIENFITRIEGRSLSGFGLIKHEVILNIYDEDNQAAFHVKADPLPDNIAHALILLKNNYQPAIIKKLRKKLIDEFNLAKNLTDGECQPT